VEVRRDGDPASTKLEVSGAAGPRTFVFREHAALVSFHAGYEQALTHLGWRLAGFEPERRSGQGRRAIPRFAERRGQLELVWSR
jgi:hypothetical protein